MAGKSPPPDYDLADRIALTAPSQVKAIGHPVRTTILGLLHERAATVSELAVALERPKSTVAHHVKVLAEAGLVQVVGPGGCGRSRSVSTAARHGCSTSPSSGAQTATTCHGTSTTSRSLLGSRWRRIGDGKLWGFIRHARISEAQASEFWERMAELVAEFDRLPRSGETVYGFAVGVYPTDHPTFPRG